MTLWGGKVAIMRRRILHSFYSLLLCGLLALTFVVVSAGGVSRTLQAQDATATPEGTPPAEGAVDVTVEPVDFDEAGVVCPEPAIPNATPFYFVGLGDVAFERGNFSGSLELFTCAIRAQPDYAPNYVKRGYAYAALLNNERAMADYNRALELDEALVSAYNNRGTLYTRLGNFGLAINDFTLATGLAPNDPVAYNNRGVVHAIEKNFDLALADFEQAITIDPDYTRPYASLAAVYSALAAQNYQRFVALSDDNASLPAGTPGEVLSAVDDSLRNGDFAVWLSLLAPAR